MERLMHKLYFFTNQSDSQSLVSNIIFMKHKEYTILFYPSALVGDCELLKQYLAEISSSTIDYMVITSLEGIGFGFYKQITQLGMHPIVVTDDKIANHLMSYLPVDQLYIIQEHQFLIEIGEDLVLQCVPTPFLHEAGSFMIYDPTSLSLISGSLFSSFSKTKNGKEPIEKWTSFHQMYFPGSEYLKPVLQKCQSLNINTILPQFGERIESRLVKSVVDTLYMLDFYNNNQIGFKITPSGRQFNYQTFSNQILRRWKEVFGTNDVLDTYRQSEIQIDDKSIEIITTSLKDFQLWHRLFEIAYEKKGISWLSVVEPIVKKLNSIYQLEYPVIYQSVIVTAQQKMIVLDEEKGELAKKLSTLEENLLSTLDRMGRCPITNEYNESFFKQYLQKTLDLSDQTNKIVLFIDIDQIKEINTNYSKEAGDETLKNVAYVINQSKSSEHLLFKRNGPGFIVFITDTSMDQAIKTAERFRNKIVDSRLFIKPITISIAMVRVGELEPLDSDNERVIDLIFKKAEYRLKQAASKGGNQIINEQSSDIVVSAGKILLIDPEDVVFLMLKQALRKENYETIWAQDGALALEALVQNKIDFIICERMIRKIDAFSLKQQINETMELSNIPFMMITYHKSKELMIRANQLNIDYIVTKPLIVEEVIGYIRRELVGRVNI